MQIPTRACGWAVGGREGPALAERLLAARIVARHVAKQRLQAVSGSIPGGGLGGRAGCRGRRGTNYIARCEGKVRIGEGSCIGKHEEASGEEGNSGGKAAEARTDEPTAVGSCALRRVAKLRRESRRGENRRADWRWKMRPEASGEVAQGGRPPRREHTSRLALEYAPSPTPTPI